LAALADLVEASGRERPSRESELAELNERVSAKALAVGPQAEFAMAIRRALPEDGIFVSEMTQVGYWSNLAFPVYEPRTYVTPGYQGTLGYGFPTALGAQVARPDRAVVSVNGDGGFGFCLNELATMARHDIPAVVVVFNDNAFGNVRRIQHEQFDGRTIASDLRNPDFVALARAFGVNGRRTETPAALETAVAEGIMAREPLLIEVPLGPGAQPMEGSWSAVGEREWTSRASRPTERERAGARLAAPPLLLPTPRFWLQRDRIPCSVSGAGTRPSRGWSTAGSARSARRAARSPTSTPNLPSPS
jgi:acetolactate synthase-1/2/3 large subunit